MHEPEANSAFESDPLRQYLAQWISTSSPQLSALLRYAALPHVLDQPLVEALLSSPPEQQAALWTQLIQGGFVNQSPEGRLTLQSLMRRPLLELWQTTDPTAYRRSNAIAATYLSQSLGTLALSEILMDDQLARLQLEKVFFLLGADDEAGLDALSVTFAEAWQSRQFHQIEQLLTYAQEQERVLSQQTRQWLRYFQAKFFIGLARYAEAETSLTQLLSELEAAHVRLRAYVVEAMADIEAQTQRWGDALQHYTQVVKRFTQQREQLAVARGLESLGLTYVSLATALGGLPEETYNQSVQPYWLRRVHVAPFLVYRYFSRRFGWLPNLYFGTNYQDWIIVRFLFEATRCFGRAQQALSLASLSLPSTQQPERLEQQQIDLQIRLADLYHRLNRWSRAVPIFAALTQHPLVTRDPYRQATLQLSMGRAELAARHNSAAMEYLLSAREIFIRYGEGYGRHQAEQLSGDSMWNQKQWTQAVTFYTQSVLTALACNDLLASTHSIATLALLRSAPQLSSEDIRQIDQLKNSVNRYAFVERFPSKILHRFRQLIAWWILPLTYGLITLFLSILAILVGDLEFLSLSHAPTFDLWVGLGLFGTIPLLLIWLFTGLYILIGAACVRWLPTRIFLENRPLYIAVFGEEIYVQEESASSFSWQEARDFMTVDRAIWRTPLSVFSKAVLRISSRTVLIEGIISHYQLFKDVVSQHFEVIGRTASVESLTISGLHSRLSTLAFGLALFWNVIGTTGLLDLQHEGDVISTKLNNGQFYDLRFISFFVYFYTWALPLFSMAWIAQFLYSRYRLRRRLGTTIDFSDLMLGLLFIFFFLLFLMMIVQLSAEPATVA